MIDPNNITNYSMGDYELQENILFWVLVAGKTASTISKSLDTFLNELNPVEETLPFEKIKILGKRKLPLKLKKAGVGCYTAKSKSVWQLVNSNIDLKKCSVNELEEIYGIGKKTSRCFLMHSRKNARHAGLDTHILKFLREKGYDTPKSTPQNLKQYIKLEHLFLKYADEAKKSPAQFDLEIWRSYAN